MKHWKSRYWNRFRFWLCRKIMQNDLAMVYNVNISSDVGNITFNPNGRELQIGAATSMTIKAGPNP